ncbi:MAG: copper-translocating P-type ATPase [Microgenomates group bacterium]|nr:copper-translocating P-type ATPase [Microgenomates group bacterium]
MKEIKIPIEKIKVGDLIKVYPGEKIPVDGVVVEGESTIDESTITGESMPVFKKKGDQVIGSTLNQDGILIFKATKVGKETMLSQIIKLVEEAQASKAPIQRLADIVSSFFVPIVLILAIFTFIYWYFFAKVLISQAVLNMIAVLIVACPCAMGLATPTAIMVATGKAAENGILVKDAESLEILHKVNTIVFDKTGTLTKGKISIIEIIDSATQILSRRESHPDRIVGVPSKAKNLLLPRQKIIQIASSLENHSKHPIAQAIVNKAKEENIEFLLVKKFKNLVGQGVEGEINGKKVYVGKLLNENDELQEAKRFKNEGKTVVYIYEEKIILGAIVIADILKEEAKEVVEQLKNMKIMVYMITGDNKQTALSIGKQAGVDDKNIFYEVLPQEKEEIVKNLKLKFKNCVLAFVGDGINDAPALAACDVGIALSTGSDIAIETASISIVNKNLKTILKAINLSKKTIFTIYTNLFWAFVYNVILIPVAMMGKINPMLASAAMGLSSVSVVTNSLLLKNHFYLKKLKYETKKTEN